MEKIICPKCGNEVIRGIPSLHEDGLNCCKNHFKCSCGETVVVTNYADGRQTVKLGPDIDNYFKTLFDNCKKK